jgi:hypothetical protein
MPEQWLLDPTSEGTGTQLDISADPYGVTEFASPAPPLDTVTASSIDTEGALIAARGDQNRQVSVTVEVTGTSQTNLDANVATLEAKVAEMRQEGGTFRRVRADGTYRTLDILAADQYEKTFDVTYMLGNMAKCQFNLVAKPFARGAEVQVGGTYSETTLPTLTFVTAAPAGDVPALGRLRITEAQTQYQSNLWWGMESKYYNAANSLLLQAESQTLRTGTTSVADAAAAGGNAASRALSSTTPVEVLVITGAHVGTYRLFARCTSTSAATTVKLGYTFSNDNSVALGASGGLLYWTPTATLHAANTYELLDFGTVTIPPAVVGTQGWNLRLWAGAASATLKVDYLWLMPVEQSGEFTAIGNYYNLNALLPGLSVEVRSDGAYHQEASTSWPPAVMYEGDYLKVPVGNSSRFTLKASRPPTTSDLSIDDISAQLWVTPRFLSMF